jgi:quercetin dioxygenase-like cupin family protein
MKRYLVALGILGILASNPTLADDAATPAPESKVATPATAATPATPAIPAEHSMVAAGDVKWVDAPPSMPKGAKFAVLSGDPSAPGVFTLRMKVPAGYKVPPHFHPETENVTLISGDMYMGLGDKFEESKAHAMSPGAFTVMPQSVHHYAGSKKGAVIQVHAMGPWGITYINPTDDPRNANRAGQ